MTRDGGKGPGQALSPHTACRFRDMPEDRNAGLENLGQVRASRGRIGGLRCVVGSGFPLKRRATRRPHTGSAGPGTRQARTQRVSCR